MLNIALTDCIAVILAPLIGALLAGLGCRIIPKALAHTVTTLGVFVAFCLSAKIALHLFQGAAAINETLYTWAQLGSTQLSVGLLVDRLTAMMMVVVTFVSLMVHIYTIGYMKGDPGYARFFGLISLFTFAMLTLVMSNNFLQLFFGWEAVGLVSYLLIGFWYEKESAIFANFKAFMVNRVGDFGFLLGIALIFMIFKTLDYATIFSSLPVLAQVNQTYFGLDVSTAICILLFIGAMGKSAQVPLHVWLPDSMEGPTPISALIHAATMVTAGVFMVARMSPLFELSETALSFVMVIGAITCFFMGLLGIVQNDIKRIIAYSTLSQLGYMVTALGASAYSIGLFHLMTHAFFKALLFLGAGSVIVALHHEQDIQRMGGLWRKIPVTYAMMLVGTLALIGFPGFSGFYSKDLVIEAVGASTLPVAQWAYYAVLSSVFVTSLYSFRLVFLVFHGKTRMSHESLSHVHETPMVILLPLILLAVPSVIVGALSVEYYLSDFFNGMITVKPAHPAMSHLTHHFTSAKEMAIHGFTSMPFYLASLGFICAFIGYVLMPRLPKKIALHFSWVHKLMLNKYGFDAFYQRGIAAGTRGLGWLFWRVGDEALIDGFFVNGTAKSFNRLGQLFRQVQSGYVYHYVFAMIVGLMVTIAYFAYY